MSSARTRSSRSAWSFRTRCALGTRRSRRSSRALQDQIKDAGAVGDLPRQGAGRTGLRAAQARLAERGHRSLPVGAADVRGRRARHGQHGDARGVRDRGAKGALAEADAQPAAVVGVFDDRAAGRLGSEAVQDARGSRWRRVGHQRREVVHECRSRRQPAVRDVHQRHVRGAARNARRRVHAGTAHAQSHQVQQRAGTGRPPAWARRRRRRSPSADSAAAEFITRCARSRAASSRST